MPGARATQACPLSQLTQAALKTQGLSIRHTYNWQPAHTPSTHTHLVFLLLTGVLLLLLLQVYATFVAQQVRPLLFAAAQAETNAEYCVTGRPVETVQKLMIRRDALIQVRGSILISVGGGRKHAAPHGAHQPGPRIGTLCSLLAGGAGGYCTHMNVLHCLDF